MFIIIIVIKSFTRGSVRLMIGLPTGELEFGSFYGTGAWG